MSFEKRELKIAEKNLNDIDNRIYMKNWYFIYYGRDCVWPATNFKYFPEFKEDPVMQRLANLYEDLFECKDHLRYRDEKYGRLVDAMNDVSRLATQMANREMKEDDYAALLIRDHPVLQETYNLLETVKPRLVKSYDN